MMEDLVTKALRMYFIKKGKSLKIIQRYLRIKYNIVVDEKILKKRVRNLSIS
jgi:DNA segregation ATPase FtsK/SpoIIIE-like protein